MLPVKLQSLQAASDEGVRTYDQMNVLRFCLQWPPVWTANQIGTW